MRLGQRPALVGQLPAGAHDVVSEPADGVQELGRLFVVLGQREAVPVHPGRDEDQRIGVVPRVRRKGHLVQVVAVVDIGEGGRGTVGHVLSDGTGVDG